MDKNGNTSKIAIILPAYNEGSVIAEVIKDVRKTFIKSNFDFDIIVIDDGSTDNTIAESHKAGARVIAHILNTGSGGATATGLSYAQRNGYSVAATLDADGQHDPSDLLRGVVLIFKDGHDLLIGSRLIDSRGMSRTKQLGNKGLSFITYLLFGVNTTDSQSGMRIYSNRALNELKWRTSGYEFCSEMLWRAKQLKMSIGEYPVKAIYTEYSKAKGQDNWNAFNIVKSLLRARLMEIFGE